MTEQQSELYKNLEAVLEDEVKIYRTLLDTVRREKELIVEANVEELNQSNQAKENMILKLRGLERIREKAARDLALTVGANAERPRLLEIAVKLLDPEASKLRSIHATLELLIGRIREFNEANGALIESSLRTINGALGVIKETLGAKPVYGQSGEKKPEAGLAGAFVSKEV
jgi:flagellar biosynthesis/type III secretory pathway chaperone